MKPFVRFLSNLVSTNSTSDAQRAPSPGTRPRPRQYRALSRSTRLVAGASALLLPVALGLPTVTAGAAPVGQGFNLNASDLRFILKQIKISEQHAATATRANPCSTLLGAGANQIPNQNGQGVQLPMGLRTVDGSCNNLVTGQNDFATADKTFPRLVPSQFRSAENVPAGFGPPGPTSYTQTKGNVFDSQPRIISNLIVDQTVGNPAAVDSAGPAEFPCTTSGMPIGCTPAGNALSIPNVAPDTGLSSPYNSWFTIFGQFFDHGLDLTSKGGSGTVFMPLQSDDPLFNTATGAPNFMLLTRSTNQPGPDGVVGDNAATPGDESADDVKSATNETSPYVDQSQTYTSHPSHQVFLREYVNSAGVAGRPVATGKLLTVDGGMATWATLKAQARTMLGINLLDADVNSVPLLATDPYGRFIRGSNGYPQMVLSSGALLQGDPTANGGSGVRVPATATKSGRAFLDDIAHHAVPKPGLTADTETPPAITAATARQTAGTYDDEMLNAHFVAGDGRVNENIGLTTVHHVFHSEHNRVTGVIDDMVTNDPAFTAAERADWKTTTAGPNGWSYSERIFQGVLVTGLTNGSAYTFQVSATNARGTSAFSVLSAPAIPLTVAGAPTIGTPTAGNASATARWTAPASNGGAAITGYSVRAFAGTTLARTQPITGNVSSGVVTGLTNGTSYTFDVAAVNAAGTGAASARSTAVTPVTAPGAPTIGAATTAQIAGTAANNGTAVARWTAPVSNGGSAITGYSVRVVIGVNTQVGGLRTAAAGTTSLTVSGLVGGTSVRFQVQARNVMAAGAFSGLSGAVTPTTVPHTPGITAASTGVAGGALAATANWTAPANGGLAINAYQVFALRVSAAGGPILGQVNSPLQGVNVRTLAMTLPAGNYQFVVRARNSLGVSTLSTRSNLVSAR